MLWQSSGFPSFKWSIVISVWAQRARLVCVLHVIQYPHRFLACMRPDESRQPQTSFAHTLQQPSVTQINHLTYVCRKLPWIYGNSCGNKWLVRYTFPSSDVFKSSNLIIIGCLKWTFFRHASMHETHNLHARRWWLEFALSIFHQCCTARIGPDVSVRVLPSSTNRMYSPHR